MSSNNKDISKIIAEGLQTFTYGSSRVVWSSPIEFACYEWLQEAYPDIFKEFIAVMEVSREN